jgi:hypothetical protein
MVEGRQHFGFLLKSGEPLGILGKRRWERLDRNPALQSGVGRAIDLAHAALADLGDDFIDAKPRSRREGQAGWIIGVLSWQGVPLSYPRTTVRDGTVDVRTQVVSKLRHRASKIRPENANDVCVLLVRRLILRLAMTMFLLSALFLMCGIGTMLLVAKMTLRAEAGKSHEAAPVRHARAA